MEIEHEQKLISNGVITEVFNSVNPRDKIKVSDIVNDILAIGNVVYLNYGNYIKVKKISDIMAEKLDFHIVLMIKYSVNTITTSDSHFDLIRGFRIYLR